MLHLRPVTTAPVGPKQVALVVDAPSGHIPAVAADLRAHGARASFAVSGDLDARLVSRISAFGDRPFPALPGEGAGALDQRRPRP